MAGEVTAACPVDCSFAETLAAVVAVVVAVVVVAVVVAALEHGGGGGGWSVKGPWSAVVDSKAAVPGVGGGTPSLDVSSIEASAVEDTGVLRRFGEEGTATGAFCCFASDTRGTFWGVPGKRGTVGRPRRSASA